MPIRGDIRIDPKYPPGTPPEQITEFDIWDGERWIPVTTASDILYKIGLGPGAGDGLAAAFEPKRKK